MLHIFTQATFWLQVAFQCISTASAFNNTIALDLDETLVSSTRNPINVSWYDFQVQTTNFFGISETIWVKKRPHVEQLLFNLAANYQIVTFTTAPQDYADQVLDILDQGGLISHRFYSAHLTDGRKDLSVVNVNLTNILLVDDKRENFAYGQEENSIIINPFSLSSQGYEHCTQDIALFKLSELLTQVLNPQANSIVQELKEKKVRLGPLGFSQKMSKIDYKPPSSSENVTELLANWEVQRRNSMNKTQNRQRRRPSGPTFKFLVTNTTSAENNGNINKTSES